MSNKCDVLLYFDQVHYNSRVQIGPKISLKTVNQLMSTKYTVKHYKQKYLIQYKAMENGIIVFKDKILNTYTVNMFYHRANCFELFRLPQ